jgi:phytoene dehydrogenase-like protein
VPAVIERSERNRDPEAIVIGSGPNGLVAACVLARAGVDVLVLEGNATRPGGAVGSMPYTRPGFVHDVGAAFFPWGSLSPAFRSLALQRFGLVWKHARFESCHPAPDGSYACIARDTELTMQHFGSSSDGEQWRRIASWYQSIEDRLLQILMCPFPPVRPALRLGPSDLLRVARVFTSRPDRLAKRWFRSEAARRVLPGLGMHVDVGPEDTFGAALGFMLGMTATTGGYAVPVGGAQSLADALVRCLEHHGGRIRLGASVTEVIVRDEATVGVRLGNGDEIPAGIVLADTDVAKLLLELVDREYVPGRVVERMRDYPRGWGTFKVDWALDRPVPWTVEAARESAVIHAGDSLDDLARFTRQVRSGALPDNPYLVIGQQSLLDPTRAPAGSHTLWAYSRVPSVLPEGGWDAHAQRFADRVEARIEALAPGFRKSIVARHVVPPPALEAMNPNLVGGDLGGGSNAWHRQLAFRPVFPYFRYRMPVDGLYLCSSYAHPGAGVHGMCGFNAANLALRDLERVRSIRP